jgi:hypothetical protein
MVSRAKRWIGAERDWEDGRRERDWEDGRRERETGKTGAEKVSRGR